MPCARRIVNMDQPINLAWLRDLRAILFDIDGVLHRGWSPLPGAAEMPGVLGRLGIAYLCVTNNASRTPAQVAEGFAAIGVAIPADHIMTSAQATVHLLRKRAPRGTPVYAIGMAGLFEPLFGDGY